MRDTLTGVHLGHGVFNLSDAPRPKVQIGGQRLLDAPGSRSVRRLRQALQLFHLLRADAKRNRPCLGPVHGQCRIRARDTQSIDLCSLAGDATIQAAGDWTPGPTRKPRRPSQAHITTLRQAHIGPDRGPGHPPPGRCIPGPFVTAHDLPSATPALAFRRSTRACAALGVPCAAGSRAITTRRREAPRRSRLARREPCRSGSLPLRPRCMSCPRARYVPRLPASVPDG